MSLRSRLFLLFGGLVAVLLGAQWWMLRSLSRDLDVEVVALAEAVGESIVKVLHEEGPAADPEELEARRRFIEVKVLAPQGDTEVGPKTTPSPGPEPEGRHDPSKRVIRLVRHNGSEITEERILGPEDSAFCEAEIAAIDLRDLKRPPEVLQALQDACTEPNSLLVEGAGELEPIPIPTAALDSRVRRFTSRMLAGTGLLLLLGLVVAGLFAHGITRPLSHLAAAARRVGEGELGVRVESAAGGEVGETVQAFNQMSARLEQLEEDTRLLRAGQHLSELGEVSRGLAHSLRNPLNALGLSLERLADEDLETEERQRLTSGARQQIRRVDGALRSFLALASSGSVPEEDVDVAALLQDVALEALQDSRRDERDIGEGPRLETGIEGDLPHLKAVQPELRAVLQALVVNAFEASPPGGEIRLRASSEQGGKIRVEVLDQGPGLPAEVKRSLFSPHVTTKEQGSGMGLFLAHRIAVNRYGGSLRLEAVEPGVEGAGGTRAVLEVGPRISLRPAEAP
ncbi:MAG: HAMP domain-containing histidine kinase [Acidobacteria bacterium]|nr:HAMP domain-containing histidine kinase [Acidobacteriota bacterium]